MEGLRAVDSGSSLIQRITKARNATAKTNRDRSRRTQKPFVRQMSPQRPRGCQFIKADAYCHHDNQECKGTKGDWSGCSKSDQNPESSYRQGRSAPEARNYLFLNSKRWLQSCKLPAARASRPNCEIASLLWMNVRRMEIPFSAAHKKTDQDGK